MDISKEELLKLLDEIDPEEFTEKWSKRRLRKIEYEGGTRVGTKADFYIGRGENAVWLGSIAWDGYPDGITPLSDEMVEMWSGGPDKNKSIDWPEGEHLFDSKTEEEFKSRLERFFQFRTDVTRPEKGWPWSWEDSQLTDYSYAFDEGKVWASCFGCEWFNPLEEQTEKLPKTAVFPNMTHPFAITPNTSETKIDSRGHSYVEIYYEGTPFARVTYLPESAWAIGSPSIRIQRIDEHLKPAPGVEIPIASLKDLSAIINALSIGSFIDNITGVLKGEENVK